MQARRHAGGVRRQRRFALQHGGRPDRGGATQARQRDHRQHRAGELISHRGGEPEAQGERRSHLCPLCRLCSGDQCTARRTCHVGARGLPERRGADAVGPAARARCRHPGAGRGAARRSDHRRIRLPGFRARQLVRRGRSGEDAEGNARPDRRLVRRRPEVKEAKEKLAAIGLYPSGLCGPDFGAFLHQQYEDYAEVIRSANIRAE
jgi:hypothetical protein